MPTRTGQFSIGLRQGRSDWQQDLSGLLAWAKENRFDAIDLIAAASISPALEISAVTNAGLTLGSIDLLDKGNITDSDAEKRRELLERNLAHLRQSTSAGARIFFTIVGGDPAKKRTENFKSAVEAFAPLAEAAADAGATIAIEGYPGAAPHYALLCTTPETVRAMLKEIPRGLAVNYDPSHLIRLGVDPLRFLREFVGHVAHVHAKDTQLYPEAVYELGLYQPSAFQPPHDFGQHTWRYTIPGAGAARWTEMFEILAAAKYPGIVSIELEDENFNGSQAGEKAGLMQSLKFLNQA
jgi:sugar phosphate isomerase/epimerase